MATVVLSVAVKAVVVPAGTVQGKWSVFVDGNDQLVDDPSNVTFTDVAPGDHTAAAVALDANGGQIGDKVSTSFTVPVPTTTLSGADVVTVSIVA